MTNRTHLARACCTLFLCVGLTVVANAKSPEQPPHSAESLVRQAFEDWRQGRGSVFDLLAEDAEWTVAGFSPVSAVYRSRQALIDEAVGPINARLATPITPEVKQVIAQESNVVVLWDGRATASDGSEYLNSYAWHMVLEGDRITRVTAFLDTWALNELLE